MIDLVDSLAFVGDVNNLFAENVNFLGDAVVSGAVNAHGDARKIAFFCGILDDGPYRKFAHFPVHGAYGKRDCFLGSPYCFSRLFVSPVLIFLEQVRFDEELQDFADFGGCNALPYFRCDFAKCRSRHDRGKFADNGAGGRFVVAEGVCIDNMDFVR